MEKPKDSRPRCQRPPGTVRDRRLFSYPVLAPPPFYPGPHAYGAYPFPYYPYPLPFGLHPHHPYPQHLVRHCNSVPGCLQACRPACPSCVSSPICPSGTSKQRGCGKFGKFSDRFIEYTQPSGHTVKTNRTGDGKSSAGSSASESTTSSSSNSNNSDQVPGHREEPKAAPGGLLQKLKKLLCCCSKKNRQGSMVRGHRFIAVGDVSQASLSGQTMSGSTEEDDEDVSKSQTSRTEEEISKSNCDPISSSWPSSSSSSTKNEPRRFKSSFC